MASEIIGGQVSVGTTAGGTEIAARDPHRRVLRIRNDGAAALYIGPSGLTATTAFDTLAAGASTTITSDKAAGDLGACEAWYGLSASGTLTVNVGQIVSN